MREVRFVGVSADGRALVVEADGEHLRLPLNDALRAAVTGPNQPALGFASPVSPREIQRRIRAGESASEIAASSGIEVERVARFEGPVLEERRHQAQRARAVRVGDRTLAELAADYGARHEPGASLSWDARLAEDGTWRLVLLFASGVAAAWSWVPASGALAPLERVARAITDPLAAEQGDVLQAVLRPLSSVPHRSASAAASGADSAAAQGETETPTEQRRTPLRARRRSGRAEVPSWDDITAGTTRRDDDRA